MTVKPVILFASRVSYALHVYRLEVRNSAGHYSCCSQQSPVFSHAPLPSTLPQIVTPHYCNFPVDLRDTAALDAAIGRAGLDPTAMTFILSECVMVYMEPRDSSALIAWLAKRFSNAVLVVYEQVWGRSDGVVFGPSGVEGAAGTAGCFEVSAAHTAVCGPARKSTGLEGEGEEGMRG